jgi:RND family efflux transporter MFP subunit
MNHRSIKVAFNVLVLALSLTLSGCLGSEGSPPAPPPLEISVSYPVEQEVTDYADYTGRAAAIDSVEVRARVWGYLDKVNFKEGALVKKGDVLFEIDPKTYQAQYDAKKAEVAQNVASVELAKVTNQRFKDLHKKEPGAVSDLDLDKYKAQEDQAVANLELAKANLETARFNLEWTKVTSPVSGRVSRTIVTIGNLVQSGDQPTSTLLTTVVSVDPVWVYFDVDDYTVLRVRKLIREGKAKSARESPMPVYLGLANEEGFPHEGTVDFVDNQVNTNTGTLRLRGIFPAPKEIITPGIFGRVRVPIGFPHKALLISDRAVDTDQGKKIVYVVDKYNKIEVRPITLGALHKGLRAVDSGIAAGDKIVVTGLLQVRPGMTVEPKVVDMPRSPVADQQ